MVRDGYFYGFGFIAVAVLMDLLAGGFWAIVPLILALFFLWFFRDPVRPVPEEPGLIVSPADGKLTQVAYIETLEGKRIRLSIFLSVFDVHVNRSPIAGRISGVLYRKGEFLNALNPESADKNEQNAVTIQGDQFDVEFRQIAGLLARRIVFHPKLGDYVGRGERVGLIKFGSRVDVLLPAHARLCVALGQRVKGGSSVLAEISPEPSEPQVEDLAEMFA